MRTLKQVFSNYIRRVKKQNYQMDKGALKNYSDTKNTIFTFNYKGKFN